MILFIGDCKPYSVKACQNAAKALGKYFRGPAYWTGAKGCYGYTTGQHKDFVFYSTRGSTYEMKSSLALPRYRPEGYDCKTYGILYFSIFLSNQLDTLLHFSPN